MDRMKTEAGDVSLIAVGGGAYLVPERLAGISEILNVPHRTVANAVGAAIAQVSGEVDQIFQNLSRDEAISRARQLTEDKAVAAGADRATLTVVELEDLPLAYPPGNSLRTPRPGGGGHRGVRASPSAASAYTTDRDTGRLEESPHEISPPPALERQETLTAPLPACSIQRGKACQDRVRVPQGRARRWQ